MAEQGGDNLEAFFDKVGAAYDLEDELIRRPSQDSLIQALAISLAENVFDDETALHHREKLGEILMNYYCIPPDRHEEAIDLAERAFLAHDALFEEGIE